MSLRIWLPLTKDLRQQGLSNITVTNTGATYSSTGGKLGGYYNFDGTKYLQSNETIGEGVKELTFACWVCPGSETLTSGQWYRILGIGSHTRSQLDISSDNKFRLFVGQTGSTSGLGVSSTTILQADTWYHICGVLGNNYMAFYVNGNRETYSTIDSSSITYTNADYFRVGTINSGNLFRGKLNDVRYYDHALSQMEIKELAKGLVLHYPLNRQGWGQENLITGYDTSFLSYPNGAVTLFSNQMNGGAQEIVSNIGGAMKCLHLHNNGGNGRQYGALSATSGKSYTISCDYYSTSSQTSPFRGELNGGDYSWKGSNAVSYTTPNKWVRLSFGYLNLTSDATIYYFMQCSQNTDCYIKNLKIEEGSIATPWCPNSSDELATVIGLNSTTEYDCSGFGNNGTRTGTFSWTSDTPRYSASTNFAAVGQVINNTSPIHLSNEFTIAWWGKINSWKKKWEGMFLLQNNATLNAGLNTYDIMSSLHANTANTMSLTVCQNSSSYAFDRYKWTYAIGTWAHYACTYKAGVISMYQNGELVYTETITDNSSNDYYYRIGYRVGACDCQMSDFRIYATALSADDVKSLYQNSAYIDSSGNVYGAVHEEV